MLVDADDGRIYLPKELRERFGSRFELVDRGDRLALVPVADDPLDALRDEFDDAEIAPGDVDEAVLDQIREDANDVR
jgi:bifunctional DNA-binding transcriptional regulator/antitoxin component of YhaV-PrlF toxin-antitoxin module